MESALGKRAWASVEKFRLVQNSAGNGFFLRKMDGLQANTLSSWYLMGTSKNKDQDGKSVQTACDNAHEFEPSNA